MPFKSKNLDHINFKNIIYKSPFTKVLSSFQQKYVPVIFLKMYRPIVCPHLVVNPPEVMVDGPGDGGGVVTQRALKQLVLSVCCKEKRSYR